MPSDRRTDAPPASAGRGRELSYEELADGAVRILVQDPERALVRALLTVGRLDEEAEGQRDEQRRTTDAIEAVKASVDNLTSAVLVSSGRVAVVDERTKTLCELFEVHREEMLLNLRARSEEVQAVQNTVNAVGTQAIARDAALDARVTAIEPVEARVREHGARLGAIEADMGEAPNDAAGRPGSGMRRNVAGLMRWWQTQTSSTALTAAGGAAGVVGVIEIVRMVLKHLFG